MKRLSAWTSLVFLLVLGCGRSAVSEAALTGDLPSLQKAIADAQKAGTLGPAEVQELAEALLRREVAAAEGKQAASRIRGLSACSAPALEELRQRTHRLDVVGAASVTLLLELGRLEPGPLVPKYEHAELAEWRAVAARSAVESSAALKRRQWFTDGDVRIRRGAFRAAAVARDPNDVPGLLEAVRLDPDPLARSLAARAATASGTKESVLGLRDLWSQASPEDRLAMLDAWGTNAALKAGGAHQLRWVLETTQGRPRVVAAGALVRSDVPDELRAQAAAALEAVIKQEGTTEERRLAIRLTFGSTPYFLPVLEAASEDADAEVQTLAWARLSNYEQYKKEAKAALKELFENKPTARAQARQVLAELGERSIAPSLVADLKGRSRGARRVAALGLIRLGEYSDAATALGDVDPNVRVATACAIVAEQGRGTPRPEAASKSAFTSSTSESSKASAPAG